MTAHRCASGLKKKVEQSGSKVHRHFVGFFRCPSNINTVLFCKSSHDWTLFGTMEFESQLCRKPRQQSNPICQWSQNSKSLFATHREPILLNPPPPIDWEEIFANGPFSAFFNDFEIFYGPFLIILHRL